MKKLLISIIAFLAISVATVEAQPRAIGTRVGYGVDFSYQHSLGKNMLNFELGVPGFWGLGAVCTYDWVFPINSWNQEGTWNWFAGVGVGGGWSWWGSANVGVAGRIGVEYNFGFPLQLSLDWRPVIGPAFYYGYAGSGVGFNVGGLYAGAISLGIRYCF